MSVSYGIQIKCNSKTVAISGIKPAVYNFHAVFNNQNYESIEQQKVQLKESQQNHSLKLNVSMKTHF